MNGSPARRGRRRALGALRAALALVGLAGIALACGDEPPAPSSALHPAPPAQTTPPGHPRPKNVLLIVSDTLRARDLGCYGGSAPTPNLSALAGRGTLFLRAYANAPWTLPSSAAIFTGNPPSQYALPARNPDNPFRFRVPDGERLLAEALGERGFQRLAVVENPVATRSNALQGFDQRVPSSRLEPGLDPRLGFDASILRNRKLTTALLALLAPSPRPFFLLEWINDPHAHYSPPSKYLPPLEAEARTLPRPLDFYTRLGHANDSETGERKLRDTLPELSPAERAFLHRLYLGEVESVDERIGYLLRALELSGRAGETLVVFTSDHGEGFGEHGTYLHGQTFYDELLHVPLIVAGPGVAAGQRLAAPVSLVDLVPTIADLLAVGGLAPVSGRSLGPLLRGEAPAELVGRAQYAVSPLRHAGTDALIAGPYKLIAADSDRGLELYDLVADPGERHDLAGESPRVAADLLRRVRLVRRDNEARRRETLRAVGELPDETDEATKKLLKSLGYVE